MVKQILKKKNHPKLVRAILKKFKNQHKTYPSNWYIPLRTERSGRPVMTRLMETPQVIKHFALYRQASA